MRSTPMNDMLYKYSSYERKKNRNIQFEYLRKTKETTLTESQQLNLDYLFFYPQDLQQKIKHSLTCPIPQPLPPLSIETISLYRRSSKPIFQTTPLQSKSLDYHMLYESLYLLAKIDKDLYPNYNGLTKQFQRQFKSYLSLNSKDIFQVAVISAGNKILGTQSDILQLIKKHPDQVWVLINHCYANKISYRYLQPFLLQENHYVLKMFYQFSNQKNHESIYYLMDNQNTIESLFNALKSNDLQMKLCAIRILGNICGQNSIEESVNKEISYNVSILLKFNVLDHLFTLIINSNAQIRKDAFWLLSNLACHEEAVTAILRTSKLLQKITEIFYHQTNLQIKKNLIHIFYFIGQYGQKRQVFSLFINQNFIELLSQSLSLQDNQIVANILDLIKRLIELGEQFVDENQQNIVILILKNNLEFAKALEKYHFSKNYEISSICSQINQRLSEKQESMEGEI